MKQQDRSRSSLPRPADASPGIRDGAAGTGVRLLQVHPVPHARDDIVSVVAHFVGRFAASQGKVAPALSEDAAAYLMSRSWRIEELATRVARAVAQNEGSLITAADLSQI